MRCGEGAGRVADGPRHKNLSRLASLFNTSAGPRSGAHQHTRCLGVQFAACRQQRWLLRALGTVLDDDLVSRAIAALS